MRARKRPCLPRLDRSLELFARLRPPSWIFKMSRLLRRVGDLYLLYLWFHRPLYKRPASVQGESAMCADDPVADAEWTAKYEKNMMEIKEQETRMNSRLDGSVEISEWYAYIKIYLWLYTYSSKIVKMLQWLWLQIV